MTTNQQLITIATIALATMATRFLPFLVFPAGRKTPKFIEYPGNVLPGAIFSLLIVYCLRNVELFAGSHGLPELIAILVVVALHTWKRQILLSIAAGTFCYMALVQFVFV